MEGLTQVFLVLALFGILAQPGSCRPSGWRKTLERKQLRHLLDLLNAKRGQFERGYIERKNETRNPGHNASAGKRFYEEEFLLPDDFFWGGEEYMFYEDDDNGHGHDVIDGIFDLDSPETALFASFEVMINGEIKRPYIDWKSMHVQLAQNRDHHKIAKRKRSILHSRNFDTSSQKWENGIIPYEIDTNTINTAEKQEKIRQGIKDMNDLTCLKIVPRASAPSVPHDSFLRFTDDKGGCWSYVGRAQSGNQDLGLSDGCYDKFIKCLSEKVRIGNDQYVKLNLTGSDFLVKSTVLHEIMHAIGMQHEQQRSDRDTYLTMVWANIDGGKGNVNMQQETTNDKNSFDLESVLMYGLYSSSTNGEKSMLLKDKRLEFLPESAKGLTFYDVKDITVDYECTKNCAASTSPTCTNTGFVGWTCKCMCPPGLKGPVCENVDSDADCGGVINLASGESRTIQSPNYPNNHPVDKSCVWLVKGPSGSKIKLTVQDLKLKYNSENERCYHWLEVRYNLIGQSGPKRCGTVTGETWETANTEINGRNNYMMLRFDSRFSKDVTGDKGFKVKVEAVAGGTSPSQPCDSVPCKNGGACTNTGASYTCQCTSSWTGPTCETKIQPCDSSPCKNGGACTNSGASYTCQCTSSWTGPTCEVKVQPCDSSPCKNGAACTNSGNTYSCSCTTGWTGPTCEVASSSTTCSFEPSSPCFLNSGYSVVQATAQTTPTSAKSGSYFAQPSTGDGYMTLSIDKSGAGLVIGQRYCLGFSYTISGSDVEVGIYDESDANYENPRQTWTNPTSWTTVSYSFTASSNDNPIIDVFYMGSGTAAVDDVTLKSGTCATASQPCDSGPCKNGGACTNTGASYTCQCTTAWTGPTCETKVQPCDSSPCKNGGMCTNSGTSYMCQCTSSWTGPTCEVATSSTSCSFEPSAPCFLNSGYSVVQATAQTTPNSAKSGNYFAQPRTEDGYMTLSIDKSGAGLVIGQRYCLGFSYTISGSDVEVGIYAESDLNFENARQTWTSPTSWTTVSYTFTASSNDNPIIDVLYMGSGTAAVDDVTLKSGQC